MTGSDQTMKKNSQNILVTAVLALVLSGCSIVVFEDGEDCPAEMVATLPSIDGRSEARELPAVSAEPDQTQLAETESAARQPQSELLIAPPMIDGYVTNFAYDSAEVGSQACLLYTSPSPPDATLSRMPSSA